MRPLPTQIEGPILIEPTVHGDERGFFLEAFREDQLGPLGIGADVRFVQENHSRSRRGVVRGMHFTVGEGMAKLVRCARGSILDVVVDLRRGSPTYGRWEGFRLDDERFRQLFVPVGFAHGFCVLSDTADVLYLQTGYYDPQTDRAIVYDDRDIGIEWPGAGGLIVSGRDASAPRLRDVADDLPFEYGR
jgi:dTDP-4-dehydrorhamnose 3,5-epimerase